MSEYLKNVWYVAAWADEVSEKMLARRLLDVPVILYRKANGEAVALHDRCPHRFAPLHLGSRVGDGVRCGYHGLEFSAAGDCVHNPHASGAIPRAAKVRAFPLIERYSMLWIWMGDAERADASCIPDFSFQDPEHFAVGKRYLFVRANYLLEVDNIMDLSHIQFLHPTTLGSSAVATADTQVYQEGGIVWSKRSTHAEVLPEFLYRARNIPSGTLCDRWIDVRWSAPASMALFAGAVATGTSRRDSDGVSQCHIFTPETRRTSHYWFGISFPKSLGALAMQLAEEQIEALKAPFELEDLPMLEAQQDNIGEADFWSLKPVLLASDGGGVRARRLLEKMQTAEDALPARSLAPP